MQKKKVHVLSLRISRGTQRKLKRCVKKSNRSLNYEIETAINFYAKEQGCDIPAPKNKTERAIEEIKEHSQTPLSDIEKAMK